MGAGPRWSLLAGLLVVAVAWAVFAVSFLTEALAYPVFAWTLWAVWRAVADPRPGTEAGALAMLVLAALTRSAFGVLVLLLPLAAAVQELRFAALRTKGPDPAVRKKGARPLSCVWRRHRLLLAAMAVGVAAVAVSSVGIGPDWHKAAGDYGTPFGIQWDYAAPKTAFYASRVVTGVGFLPFAVGLPWLLRELAAPRSPGRHAYAIVGIAAIVILVYASQSAGTDERYVIYFGPIVTIAAVVALARRDLSPWLVAAGGLLAAVLLWRHGWNPNGGPYGFYIGPSETFYARVVLLRLGGHLPGGLSLQTASFVLALGLAAVCAFAFTRGRRAATTAAVLLALLVVVQLWQSQYAVSSFVRTAGERYGGPSLEQRAWVDGAIHGRSKAAVIALAEANTAAWDPTWQELQFWNTSIWSVFSVTPPGIQVPIGDYAGLLRPDDATGAVRSTRPVPEYGLVPRAYADYGFAGTVAAASPYLPVDLVRLSRPLQARFHVVGPAPDGGVGPRDGVSIRFFRRGLTPADGWCARVSLTAPGGTAAQPPLRWRLGPRAGTVPAGKAGPAGRVPAGRAVAPLRFGGAAHVDLRLELGPSVRVGGRSPAGRIGRIEVVRCGG